ncbi:MAG: ABC transporter ATPase [bacterium]|nr:ABC transporter ATPase [bacterium]
MRTLEDFKINSANDTLKVTVTDEPGAGGANHLYMIEGFDTSTNASDPFVERHGAPSKHTTILFQNGPINEKGVNGITHEVLLSIVCDRLRSFQAGPFASRENALALTKLEEAQHWLLHRTRARMARGVEGTHKV